MENKQMKYLPWLALFFFFNGFLLPEGWSWTALLTPFLLVFLYRRSRMGSFLLWMLLLLIPVPFHLMAGVESRTYIISSLLSVSALVFFLAAAVVVRDCKTSLGPLFSNMLGINSWLVLAALLVLPILPIRDFLWYSEPISPGIEPFPRLKLLAWESSHYALLLAPVFLYHAFRVLWSQTRHPLLLSLAIAIPLLLSLSFGVIAAMLISLLITGLALQRSAPPGSGRKIIYCAFFMIAALMVVFIFWQENPVFMRMQNIAEGSDTSARGRLNESFMFAWDLARSHGLFFGCGPGQVKVLAPDFIALYYQYQGELPETFRIPNAMAETLAVYGLYGFLLKLFLVVYFFFRKKTYQNAYSLTLFVFIFIYQFTGSFLANAAELGIWAVVFHADFKEFDIQKKNSDIR